MNDEVGGNWPARLTVRIQTATALRAPNTTMTPSLLLPLAALLSPGDTPPPGPPWLLSYRQARLDAIERGRPVFVYFSKTY